MRRRILLAVTAAIAVTGAVAPSASATGGDGFSCRASTVRVQLLSINLEPFVANPANVPCNDAHAGLLGPTTIGPVTASALNADTNNDNGGHAEASVAKARVGVTALPVITADVLSSEADSSCVNGKPVLTGSSEVVGLKIGSVSINVPSGPATFNLGLGTLYLNEKVVGPGNQITVRALRLDTVLVDVVIAESRANVSKPCPEDKPECSDGVDNGDPEDSLADAQDPGCHTDGNPNNPGSYDPNDDDETDKPECSDGFDNDDDNNVDAFDPGCHTDSDPSNPDSYDPNDDDETNVPKKH